MPFDFYQQSSRTTTGYDGMSSQIQLRRCIRTGAGHLWVKPMSQHTDTDYLDATIIGQCI